MKKTDGALKGCRKALTKGRISQLGPFETLKLKIVGRIDGHRGLPKDSKSGLMSPHLDKELHAYEEACTKIWGGLQLFEQETYARIRTLDGQIAQCMNDLPDAEQSALRREGEEQLNDAQVTARRAAEKNRLLKPFRAKLGALREEKTDLEARLVEQRHCVQMVSNRLAEHLSQRSAVYWNAARVCHPDRESLPPVLHLSVTSHAEQLYVRQHAGVLEPVHTNDQEVLS